MPSLDDHSRGILTLIMHRVQQSASREHRVMGTSGSRSDEGSRYSVFDSGQSTQWALLLYLLYSHTTPLHKPDSPLSQSWCKQQESYVSSQSWAGEWISTWWHVICIDSTEGLLYDVERLRERQRRNAVIHQHLKSSDLFFFFPHVIQTSKSQSDSYPDRRKTPRLHI